MLPYLKPDGAVVVNSCAVIPASASLSGFDYRGADMVDFLKRKVGRLSVVDGGEACEALGSPRVLNMVLLGAAVRTGQLGVGLDDIAAVLPEHVKPQFIELNTRALNYLER